MRIGWRSRFLCAGWLTGLAFVSGCKGGDSSHLQPVVRIGEQRGEIKATVGDETRYVLSEIRRGPFMFATETEFPRSGPLVLERSVPPVFSAEDRLVVAARGLGAGGRWVDLAAQVVPLAAPENGGGKVTLVLDTAAELAGRRTKVMASAWVPHPGGRSIDRSRPIEVPPGAILEVGGGFPAAGRGQGDVRFTVSVCRANECQPVLDETVGGASAAWSDWRVQLDDFAGETVTCVFETTLRSPDEKAFSLAVWSRPVMYAPKPVRRARPNVILLSIDTLGADHLSTYGSARDTAPMLGKWFEEDGVVFDHLVAAATTTGPSHMTIFTSLVPTVHGVTKRPAVRSPAPITLAEVLRRHGYATAAVTENGPLHAGWGFSRGFDSYVENKSADVMLPEGHVAATLGRAERWLRRNGDRPFFLFLHTFEVHYPYAPPARYAALFGGSQRRPGLPPEYSDVLYDREIRHVDDQMDRFLTKLEASRALERTIVIVTSDHGEEFLEHGLIGHGVNLHPEVLRVPLLVRGPGIRGGRRIASPVGHSDIMPTILELIGLPPADVTMGRSLAPLLAGAVETVEDVPLYSEAWYATAMGPQGKTFKVEQPRIAVRLGNRKLVRINDDGGFAYRYYHLSNDPQEHTDVYLEHADEVADLQRLLARYEPSMNGVRRGAEAARRRFDESAGQTAARGDEAGGIDVDPAVREKLRALGYVE